MKNCFLVFLLCLVLSPSISQDTTFISYGFELSPRIITNVFESNGISEPIYPLSGSATGNVYLNISQKLKVKTGIGLHQMRIGQKDYSILLGCDHDGNGGSDQYNSWIQSNHSILYLGIPTEINYYLSDKKSKPYLKIGGTILINLKEEGNNKVHECGGASTFEIAPPQLQFAEFLVLLKGGFGYELDIKNRFAIYFEPSVELSINPFLQSGSIFPASVNLLDKHIVNYVFTTGLRF